MKPSQKQATVYISRSLNPDKMLLAAVKALLILVGSSNCGPFQESIWDCVVLETSKVLSVLRKPYMHEVND